MKDVTATSLNKPEGAAKGRMIQLAVIGQRTDDVMPTEELEPLLRVALSSYQLADRPQSVSAVRGGDRTSLLDGLARMAMGQMEHTHQHVNPLDPSLVDRLPGPPARFQADQVRLRWARLAFMGSLLACVTGSIDSHCSRIKFRGAGQDRYAASLHPTPARGRCTHRDRRGRPYGRFGIGTQAGRRAHRSDR